MCLASLKSEVSWKLWSEHQVYKRYLFVEIACPNHQYKRNSGGIYIFGKQLLCSPHMARTNIINGLQDLSPRKRYCFWFLGLEDKSEPASIIHSVSSPPKWIHLDVPYHQLLIDGKCYLKPSNFSQEAPQIDQWSYSNPSDMLLYKILFPKD